MTVSFTAVFIALLHCAERVSNNATGTGRFLYVVSVYGSGSKIDESGEKPTVLCSWRLAEPFGH
jgi:hypothetical protein